jgi:DNA invertase Pin-like site-specific DNA recombinase
MRVALYARVSTRDKGQDTENQLAQLREFAKTQGWIITAEYVDHATGKRSNRQQFKAMFAASSRREFDVVLAWALDRLSREGVAQTFEHIKMLLGYGVQFISYTEAHFRTTGPAGELMIAIAAWIAQQERIRLSERTIAGLQRARKQGRIGGRPTLVVDRERIARLDERGSPRARSPRRWESRQRAPAGFSRATGSADRRKSYRLPHTAGLDRRMGRRVFSSPKRRHEPPRWLGSRAQGPGISRTYELGMHRIAT